MSRSTRTRTLMALVALALASLLAAAVAALAPTAATAAPGGGGKATSDPVATSIVFSRIESVTTSLPAAAPGARDLVYVVQDEAFEVDLSFVDAAGLPAPLSANKTVTVVVRHGTTVLGSVEVPPGETDSTTNGPLVLTIADAVSDTALTATANRKPNPVTSTSRTFDVLIESDAVRSSALTSIGGESADATVPCAPGPETVCADLIPPNGQSFGAGGLLSRGVCNGCTDSYVQALVTFPLSVTNPATLVMKCDKDACGLGAIKSKTLDVTISPGSLQPGDLRAVTYEAPACPEKGIVDYTTTQSFGPTNLPFCVDYVQSTRSNAGDTHLYLLFVEDAKIRFP